MKTSTIFLLAFSLSHLSLFAQKNLNSLWQKALPNAWMQYEDLKPLSEERAQVRQNGLWGIVDLKGNQIIAPKFKTISTSFNYWFDNAPKCLQVSIDEVEYGLIDYDGETIVPVAYKQFSYLENGHIRACTFLGECREFLANGKDVTPPILKKYRCSVQQKGGLTAASQDGRLYGFLDTLGNWVVEPKFSFYFGDECGIWFVYGRTGGMQVVLPQNPSWESPEFEWAQCFGSGFYGDFGDGIWHEFDQFGNSTGQTKTNFEPGIFNDKQHSTAYREMGLSGLISTNGNEILPPIYADINRRKIGDGRFNIVENTGGKFGIFHDDKWIVPISYDGIHQIENQPFFAAMLGDSTFVFDTLGITVDSLPFQAREHYSSYYIDGSNKKYFWSPGTGLASLPKDAALVNIVNSAVLVRSFDNSYSILDEKGRIVLDGYDAIQAYNALNRVIGCYLIQKNGLWGMRDPTLQYGFEPQYTSLTHIGNGRFIAKKEWLFGLIDYKNQQLFPFEFDDAAVVQDFLLFRRNGLWAIYNNKTLEKITDFEFEEIRNVKPEFFVARKNGLYALYGRDGEPLSNETFAEAPSFLPNDAFIFGEKNQKAIYSTNGVRMTAHEFSNVVYLERSGNDKYFLKAYLPNGGSVFFDKNIGEIKRADELIVCPNGSVAVRHKESWQIDGDDGHVLTDRYYKSLLQIGLNRFYFQFFAGQDTGGIWHIVDIIGRSVYQFEADEVGYLGGRNNLEQLYFEKSGKRYLLKIPGFITKELKYENGEEGLVQLNGKYGYVNRAGKVIITCEYDEVTDAGETNLVNKWLIAAKKGQRYDIYDRFSGELLIKDVDSFKKYDWLERVFYSKGGKTGEIWPQLGKLGELKYSGLWPQTLNGATFYVAAYSSADSFAVLDRNLKEVFPPVYSRIQFMEVGNLLLKDFNGKQWFFDGKELLPAGTEFPIVRRFGYKLLIRKNDKFSFVKFNGKLVENLPTGWLENQYRVGRDEYVLRITKDRETYFCYTDGKNRVIGPVQVSEYLEPTTFIIKKASKYGIYDLVDGYLATPNFDTIQEIKNLGYLVKKQGKWGILDKSGKTILPIKFDFTPFVATDHIIARTDGKFRFYTTTGKPIFNESYEYAQGFKAYFAPVCKEGKWGYIDMRGNLAIPYQFDYAHTFVSDERPIAWVIKGDSTYYIDASGNPASNLPTYYGSPEDKFRAFDPTLLFPLERQRHAVKIGSYKNFTIFFDTLKKGYGIVSYSGKVVLEPEAETINWLDNNNSIAFAWIQQNGKYGFLTQKGKLVLPQFDKYELQGYRSLKVSKDGKDYYLLEDGTLKPISY